VRGGGGRGPPPRKKIAPKILFGWILTQFLTGRKHGQSLQALGHGLYGSIAKRSLQNSAKNMQKFAVRPKGGVAPSPAP